jgi:hypothetical protein
MAARLKLLLLFEESFLESAFLHLFAASALGSSSTDLHFDPAGCFFSVLTLASFDSCSGKQLNGSGASSEMVLLSSTCPLSSSSLASAEACKASKANDEERIREETSSVWAEKNKTYQVNITYLPAIKYYLQSM